MASGVVVPCSLNGMDRCEFSIGRRHASNPTLRHLAMADCEVPATVHICCCVRPRVSRSSRIAFKAKYIYSGILRERDGSPRLRLAVLLAPELIEPMLHDHDARAGVVHRLGDQNAPRGAVDIPRRAEEFALHDGLSGANTPRCTG